MTLKRTVFIAAAVLVMLLMCSFCQADDINLLKNADFLRIGNDGLPDGWYTDAYISEPGYTSFGISEGDPSHPVAVTIQNIGENDARFAQTVEVEPDSLYCFSGYVRAEDVKKGHGANLSVEGIYAFSDKCFDTEGEWEYIEYYGETGPEQHSLTVFARLGGYSGESTGKAWFANLSLTKVNRVPGDGIADLWYRAPVYEEDDYGDDEETEEDVLPQSSRNPMIIIIFLYTIISLAIIYREHQRNIHLSETKDVRPIYVFAMLFSALLLRMIISWFVEGYMVDVNCFRSWGHTMASVGPAGFYEATSFCDYPPLYTYILAFNSVISNLLGGSEQVSRIAFRLIPSLCDLAGCWMLYKMLTGTKTLSARSCFLFLSFSVFNPATVLNSAAWGQMDSVLCILLLCVAMYAVQGKWKAVLPLYVVAVLIKPQALMLGPLGLTFVLISWIRNRASRKQIITGTGISFLVLAAGIIPFSINQKWDWLIQLYIKTLGSYPYATVNTANLYYVLGGNWSAVNAKAHILAPIVLGILCAGYGIWWYLRARRQKYRIIETLISGAFALCFMILGITQASWAWTGGTAMVFAFVVVLSPAVRSGDIRLLPWLGGLLFILLYVFGVKMHERYIFPALLLLSFAWVLNRDRRILYVILFFTFTLFTNEWIVLDNSIRLGSELGHLNNDTVWFADLISILNIIGSIYAVWLGLELYFTEKKKESVITQTLIGCEWQTDRKLNWNHRDTILLGLITAVYSVISLLTLGSAKAPQTTWCSSSPNEQIVFDLGESRKDIEILYFAQVSRNDFSFSASEDGIQWGEEIWAQMDQGQCWKWKYVTEYDKNGDGSRNYHNADESFIYHFNGRYIRLTAQQLGLKLNELLFRNSDGSVIPVTIADRLNEEKDSELYSEALALIDEQDTMEGLPAISTGFDSSEEKILPSWWNSTYFDEIYHARTGYEFLKGTVPYETTHPPLGKVFISLWIAVFGMTPFGWRFAGAFAGILMLPGMYLIGKQLTKKTWLAVLSCLLMALDCFHLTQTQIATIDSFPVLFILFAYFFMLRFIQTDIFREKLSVSLANLALSGLFMGLSIASKWIGIYAGAGLAVLFFWHCARMIRLHKKTAIQDENTSASGSDHEIRLQMKNLLKRVTVICLWCILFFVVIPVIIYLISYIPYMSYNSQRIHSILDYLNEVWRCQINMLNYHSTPGLGMDHPFYSPWWQWPIMGKPMYYASKQYLPSDYPVHHSIFAFGNPVIWYSGLAALLLCMYRLISSNRYRIGQNDYLWHIHAGFGNTGYFFIIIGILAQYLPWVLVPRGTYIYHYFASLPFLMTAVCRCFKTKERKKEKICMIVASVYIITAAVFFILLFPYASGMNVSDAWLDIGRHFARIWY